MLIRINKNKEIKINEEPWREEGPNSVLNSWWSFVIEEFIATENFLGSNQNTGREKEIISSDLSQFKGRLKLAEGSKTEKRLVIIPIKILFV